MEKVWDELKRIEAQAEQIQMEAKETAKKITQQAKADADTLIANSKKYGEEQSQRLYAEAVAEANKNRELQLKTNSESADKLKVQAQKNMDKAVLAIVEAVLEES